MKPMKEVLITPDKYLLVELRTEIPEDLLIPPLPELSYICDGRLTESRCSGISIFRDQDFITATASDMVMNMSVAGLVRTKLRGRKRERWNSYLAKYKIEIEPREFTSILKTGSILTIYVDGIDLDEISGNVVVKEFRVTGVGNSNGVVERLSELEPRLIVVETRGNLWFLVTAYKPVHIDVHLRKAIEKTLHVVRMECDELLRIGNGRICYLRN